MSRARELQAADSARHHVAGCTCPAHTPPKSPPADRETFVRPTKKSNYIMVKLTVPQAQALVEAGEEWPDFTDMEGVQLRASKRGAQSIRAALLAIGRGPTWK